MFTWDRKIIQKEAWRLTFQKGLKAWLLLVCVCFIFSFVGASSDGAADVVDVADAELEMQDTFISNNMEILDQYILNSKLSSSDSPLPATVAVEIVNSMSKSVTWFVNLLAANFAYFQRNEGEVIAMLLVAAVISFIVKYFLQNAFAVGEMRYTMEARFEKEVKIGRIFTPFHRENLWNVIKVMFIYNLVLALWMLTIVGYFYKRFQYAMVPYILAENPKVKWKDAKRISKEMTDGYKWEMFLCELSVFYILIWKAVPLVGLLFSIPYEKMLTTEMYFTLRERVREKETVFIENAFNGPSYQPGSLASPQYLLDDVIKTPEELRKDIRTDIKHLGGSYNLYDYIFFFFVFSLIGWFWEVGLHLVQEHEFVNRGTMYGPWIPIYGTGGVVIILLLDRLKANRWQLFVSTIVLCAILEYASSWILDYFMNSSYWDYKNMFLNLNGRICFAGLLAFGLGGQFGVYVAAPRLSAFLDKLGKKKVQWICSVLVALFAVDLMCCLIFGFNSGSGVGGEYETALLPETKKALAAKQS